jgi:hypothetical protein
VAEREAIRRKRGVGAQTLCGKESTGRRKIIGVTTAKGGEKTAHI